MKSLWQDARYSVRVLVKSPGFALAAVMVLALGIGANTAIFSVVNAAFLRPLPFKDPSRLVQVWHVPPARSFPGMTQFAVSAANYLDWARQNHVFEKTAIYTWARYDLASAGNPESVQAGAVESTFFGVFGVSPILGRTFLPGEDRAGHGKVAVLSYAFWRSRFGAKPEIVGQKINLNGDDYTVVGVMGPTFNRPDWAMIWTPLAWTDKERSVRGEHHYMVVARLRPGVDQAKAQAEMNTISERLEQRYPADDKGWGAVVVPMRDQMVGDVRPALLVLLGAVAFVLLIACANISNLVLARTVMRRKEMGIRAALGAGRGRLVQQVLAETLLLSLAGGGVGLLLASPMVRFIASYFAGQLPKAIEIKLDVWVLGFTLGISLVAGMLAGLLPAWRFTHSNLNDVLKQGMGRTDAGSRGHLSALVVSEVALSLVLLVGAGLMIRSLWNLHNVDPGLDPHNLLTMTVSVQPHKFSTPSQQADFFERVRAAIAAQPGIESAGVTDDLPTEGGSTQPIQIEGRPVEAMADQPEVAVRTIDPAYLHTMEIPLLRGRGFTAADSAGSHPVALITEAMAGRFWPGQDPIGKHIRETFSTKGQCEIVGEVGNIKQNGLDVVDPIATIYFPVAQMGAPAPGFGEWSSFPMSLVVRTASNPSSAAGAIVAAIHGIDPTAPVLDVRTMDSLFADSVAQHRLNMLLLAAFAALALLLAAVGIYSVLAYAVRRRVREIGLRMALGAQTKDVLGLVIADGLKPALLGVAIGWMGALALSRVVAKLVFGVKTTDPATFAAVSALLVAVALLACVAPAYRATRLEPVRALQDE
jgi:putative ABC transport system permease protein